MRPLSQSPFQSEGAEEWRIIPDYAGRFEVSDWGRIRRAVNSRCGGKLAGSLVKLYVTSCGYHRFTTTVDLKRCAALLHRIVVMTFVGPIPPGWHVAHLNGNPGDNRLVNLKACTPKENASHKYGHGTMPYGEANCAAKLTAAQVAEIRASSDGPTTLGRRFGVDYRHIWRIRNGTRWPNVGAAA